MRYLLWAGLLLWGLCSFSSSAKAADVDQVEMAYPEILSCFKIDNAKMVRNYRVEHKGMKLFVMEIDTNEDGVRDGMLLYPIFSEVRGESIDVSTVPAYLILDRNYDGSPDVAYFDRTRTGACETLLEIDLSILLRDAPKTTKGI